MEFREGLTSDSKSLYFPGGPQGINVVTISPLAWEDKSDFRIWNSIGIDGWFDVPAPKCEENVWTHFNLRLMAICVRWLSTMKLKMMSL